MSKVWKERLIKYSLSTIFILAGLYYHIESNGGWEQISTAKRYLVVCDGLSIPAMIEIMLGCMFLVFKSGAFDAIRYWVNNAVIKSELRREESFAEYVKRVRENRTHGYGFLFITGIVAIGVALVFMYLYYQAI